MAIDELRKAMREATERTVFVKHPAFKEGVAQAVRAGNLTMICATPLWWESFARECEERSASLTNYSWRDGRPLTFQGVAVRSLEWYCRDPDWPVILEAIIRLKLLDISAVFR